MQIDNTGWLSAGPAVSRSLLSPKFCFLQSWLMLLITAPDIIQSFLHYPTNRSVSTKQVSAIYYVKGDSHKMSTINWNIWLCLPHRFLYFVSKHVCLWSRTMAYYRIMRIHLALSSISDVNQISFCTFPFLSSQPKWHYGCFLIWLIGAH